MSIKEINDKFVEHENLLQHKIMDLSKGNKELADKMEAHVDAITECYTKLLEQYNSVGKELTKEEKETREEILENRELLKANKKRIAELIGAKT
jgi:hypothetical protein